MVTKISLDTKDKIRFFKRRFRSFGYGEGHYILACHAAFPIALTPDLLYQLWANFRTYPNRRAQTQSISELAVSDLLLSTLCREVSREVFEMDVEVRAFLLEELKEDERFGEESMQLLGNFLYQYMQEVGITLHPKAFVDAQIWTALATIAPKQAANEITKSLSEAINNKNDKEIFRMRNLLENYSNQEGAFENLLHYSKGVKAAILNYDMTVIQEQMNYSGAKILTIEEGGIAADTIVEVPLLEDIQDKVELAEEKVNSTGIQKALHRINQEAELQTGKLDLSGLALQNIPDEVFALSHLKELDLFNNQIATLSSKIQQLKNLEKLLASKNPITQLPAALQNLQALKTIKLNEGQLTDFPMVLLKTDSLENISLENNQLDFIPSAIVDLPNLKFYNFQKNPILNLPEYVFKGTKGQMIRHYLASLKKTTIATPIVLILSADPENKINEEEEIRTINNLLREQVGTKKLQVIIKENTTLLEFFQVCQQHQEQIKILHFAFYHLELPNEKGEMKAISPRLLNKFLGNLPNCELIVFNVCDSAELAELTCKNNKTASIGIAGKITDSQAVDFSQELYENLLKGNSIKEACQKIVPKYTKKEENLNYSQVQSKYSTTDFDTPLAPSLIKLYPDSLLEALKINTEKQLTEANLEATFKLLQQEIGDHSSVHNGLIALQSRFISEEKTYRQNLITNEQYQLTQNQLRHAILELIEELQEDDLAAVNLLNKIPFPKETYNFNESITKSSQPMPVLLKGNPKEIDSFKRKYMTSPFLQLTEIAEDAIDYALAVEESTLSIQDSNSGLLIHGTNATNEAGVEYIKTKLEAIEKWKRIGNLKNESSLAENKIDFVFFEEEASGELKEHSANKITLTYPEKEADEAENEEPIPRWYTIKARNNTSQALYFSLLYLSNNFGIEEYFPCQEIPAQSEEIILDDQHGLIISNPNQDYSIDNFLLIVSTEQFDVSRLKEDELEMGKIVALNRANRKIQKRGMYSIRESKDSQEWFTKKIRVTLKRKGIDNTAEKSGFPIYHRLTCNRIYQLDAFNSYINKKKENELYFNLIYGEGLNAPKSFFRRIVMELDGRAMDYLNPEVEILDIYAQTIPLEFSKSFDITKLNLIKKLAAIYELPLNTVLHELTLEAIFSQSPKVDEIACLYIEISEYDWDLKTTPHLINWFINDFCRFGEAIGGVKFYCFFSFVFEEDDMPIEEEVINTFQQHQQINILPKLEKVSRRDVKKWFSKYHLLTSSTRERNQILNQYFEEKKEFFYMEDVETVLRKIIDDYNNNLDIPYR